jgi:hypothetical protein
MTASLILTCLRLAIYQGTNEWWVLHRLRRPRLNQRINCAKIIGKETAKTKSRAKSATPFEIPARCRWPACYRSHHAILLSCRTIGWGQRE